MECERCQAKSRGYELFDYCSKCCKNLCPGCMKDGCCGRIPAASGQETDHHDESEC